jgi:zona occludens toxin (predicted ATPase)
MIYVITGKPGAGKSTVATDRAIQEYLRNGRRVVANYRIDVKDISIHRNGKLADANVQVLNTFPTSEDLINLGVGGESEEQAGALILDECGMWLNSRSWNNKDRELVINWLLKSRHMHWDVFLVVQDYNLLDKQVRDGVCEMVGKCRRADRIKFLGIKMPRFHICVVRYGPSINDVKCETWMYRGTDAHKCFNSYSYQNPDTVDGPYSVIPPRLSKWRYIPQRSKTIHLKFIFYVTTWLIMRLMGYSTHNLKTQLTT